MRPHFAARVAISMLSLASCAALAEACSSASSSGTNLASAGFGAMIPDAGADAADAEVGPTSLAFEGTNTLTLAPKATQVLRVAATPPGKYLIRFALLGSGSDGDAALDANEVESDDQGIAEVTLTAPSTPSAFSVRASSGAAQVQIGVSITASNSTTLDVVPSYSGKRAVTTWTATVSSGVVCADLVGDPPPDGNLVATAPAGQTIELTKVPVGVALAVTVRAGHYIGGCVNLSPLSETDGNQALVYASDRPLNLDATALDLSFGPTNPSTALSKLMNETVTQVENTLGGATTSDVSALLDAMHDATSTAAGRDSFSAAREADDWDATLTAAFGVNATSRLREPADRWLEAGLARFYVGDAFSAQLGPTKGGALLSLNSVAQVAATDAGFASSFPATWSADSSDTLLLGTELTWVPSRLVTALALLPATSEVPNTTSVEAALAQVVDCTLVATTLVAHGSTAGSFAYDACDQSCSVSTCVSALAALWDQAAISSGSSSAALSVTGTGQALVGDDASITSLAGSWLGELQLDPDSAVASGPLNGQASTN